MMTFRRSRSATPDAGLVSAGRNSYEAVLVEVPDLETIRAVADLAATNLKDANGNILRGYTMLSQAFGRLLHGDTVPPENATFLTFAAWATETIRPQVVGAVGPKGFRPGDLFRPASRLYTWAADGLLGSDDTIARNLVRGEAAIYEEIAMAVRMMLQCVLEGIDESSRRRSVDWPALWAKYSLRLKEMQTTLNAQRDASEAVEPSDVSVLQRATEPYFSVLSQRMSRWDLDHVQRKRRAELILLGNIRMLAYEQKRIQPVLRRNLAYVPDAVRARVGSRMTGRNTLLSRTVGQAYDRSKTAIAILDEVFQIAATRNVYSMIVGTEEIRLGRDLPVPPPANPVLRDRQAPLDQQRYRKGAFFPYDLQTLTHRPTWAEWQLYDRSTSEGARTAVDNWLRYGERLSFLVNLFRSRQQVTSLYDTPRSTPSATPPRPAALGPALEHLSDVTKERLANSFRGSS
jgi:hypothetical protein